MENLFVGLMSGTSMDGIDAALVEFSDSTMTILQTLDHAYPTDLRDDLLAAIRLPVQQDISNVDNLNRRCGECFRDAALALLRAANVKASDVKAIGSHGQTLRHQPNAVPAFTLQIGDPQIIAAGTGITTIADFRSADIAAGGQGAPLTPIFHEWLFRKPGTHRAVLNIGGIANLTLLTDGLDTIGFDTGPGNTLMDAWIREHRGVAFDRDGEWAGSGTTDEALLQRLLSDAYFAAKPPKSTGFEQFNLHWMQQADLSATAATDVQATLCALTATTISDALQRFAADVTEVLVCGGGVHNLTLMAQLQKQLPGIQVASTATAGLNPDWVEAVAFAWLALRRLQGLPGNLPGVTGARAPVALGVIHQPV
jgi:anhydro-N-acetylmuramic acid kinase